MKKGRKNQPHTCSFSGNQNLFPIPLKEKGVGGGVWIEMSTLSCSIFFFLYLEPNCVSWLLLTPRNSGNIWLSSLNSWKREGKLHYKGLLVRQMNNVCLPYCSAQEFLINLSLHSFPFLYLATLLSLQHILF